MKNLHNNRRKETKSNGEEEAESLKETYTMARRRQ